MAICSVDEGATVSENPVICKAVCLCHITVTAFHCVRVCVVGLCYTLTLYLKIIPFVSISSRHRTSSSPGYIICDVAWEKNLRFHCPKVVKLLLLLSVCMRVQGSKFHSNLFFFIIVHSKIS